MNRLDHIGEFGPFDGPYGEIQQEEVWIYVCNASGAVFDGLGVLIDGEYMEEPINRFKIVAMGPDEVEIGYTLGGYSPLTLRGYSAMTEVDREFRRKGMGSELLRQKTRLFRSLGAMRIYSMVGSDEGRGMLEKEGFEYDDDLTAWAMDEFYALDVEW